MPCQPITIEDPLLANALIASAAAAVDAGTAELAGAIRFLDKNDVILAEIDLQDPAFTVDGGDPGVYNLNGVPLQTVWDGVSVGPAIGGVLVGGVIAKAIVLDRDRVARYSGVVSIIGGDGLFEVDNISVELNDTLTLFEHKLLAACP